MLTNDLSRSLVILLMASGCIATVALATGGASVQRSAGAVIDSALPLVPLALAATTVLAMGDLDLSIGGLFSASGMILLALASAGVNPWLGYTIGLLAAVSMGLLQGHLVARRGASSLIVSLACGLLWFGCAIVIEHMLRIASEAPPSMAGAFNTAESAKVYRTLPDSYLLKGLLEPFVWCACVVGLMVFWRYRTLWGLRHIAIGADRHSSLLAGLPIIGVRASGFVASSVLAFLAACLTITGYQRGGWDPRAGAGLELFAIACAVIGGTSATGGTLFPLGSVSAVILWQALAHLQYVLPFVGPEVQQLVLGGLLLLVAVLTSRTRIHRSL